MQEFARHTFVFIGGLHKSGTSILFKSLREHPAISGFHGSERPVHAALARVLRTPAGADAARVIRERFAARIERWGYRADG